MIRQTDVHALLQCTQRRIGGRHARRLVDDSEYALERLAAREPTLIFGDGDMYRPEHVIDFYQLIGGGKRDPGWQRERMPQNRLAILPDLTHYEMSESPLVATTARTFFDAKPARVAKQ